MKNRFRWISIVIFASLAMNQATAFEASFNQIEEQLTQKHHSHGSRGPRGHRGHRGHAGPTGHVGAMGATGAMGAMGPTGPQNPAVAPAYIGRFYDEPLLNIARSFSDPAVYLPLGNSDGGVPAVLLQYVDLDPLDVHADKYVQVLPGGAGKYIVQCFVKVLYPRFAFPPPPPVLETIPLDLQLQIDSGSGYDTSGPLDTFPQFQGVDTSFPTNFMTGGMQALVTLQDGDKIHIEVTGAPNGAQIAGGIPTRSVSFFMNRISL